MRDLEYFVRRAEQEAERAQQATIPAVASAHYRLSAAYLDRVQALSETVTSSRICEER